MCDAGPEAAACSRTWLAVTEMTMLGNDGGGMGSGYEKNIRI